MLSQPGYDARRAERMAARKLRHAIVWLKLTKTYGTLSSAAIMSLLLRQMLHQACWGSPLSRDTFIKLPEEVEVVRCEVPVLQ